MLLVFNCILVLACLENEAYFKVR